MRSPAGALHAALQPAKACSACSKHGARRLVLCRAIPGCQPGGASRCSEAGNSRKTTAQGNSTCRVRGIHIIARNPTSLWETRAVTRDRHETLPCSAWCAMTASQRQRHATVARKCRSRPSQRAPHTGKRFVHPVVMKAASWRQHVWCGRRCWHSSGPGLRQITTHYVLLSQMSTWLLTALCEVKSAEQPCSATSTSHSRDDQP